MVRKRRKQPITSLPQKPEQWYVEVRKMRFWVNSETEGGAPRRPYGILVFNLTGRIPQSISMHEEKPDAKIVLESVFEAILNPTSPVSRKRYRPEQVVFSPSVDVDALRAELAAVQIQAAVEPLPEIVGLFVDDLEHNINPALEYAGLLDKGDIQPDQAGSFFASAAAFYRKAPWVRFSDEDNFAVTIPPDRKPRIVVVSGHGGMEYGLAIYKRWKDIERFYQPSDHYSEIIPKDGLLSLFFNDPPAVPFSDLEAIETYGWDVAEQDAYPVLAVIRKSGWLQRPKKAELAWCEAALRGLLVFFDEHVQTTGLGQHTPVEADVTVETHAGQKTIHIKYPAGEIPKATRPPGGLMWESSGLGQDEWEDPLLPIDPRAVEGMFWDLGTGPDDSILSQAQRIMYDAWDEPNPIRRISLAQQALSVSSDCADAYVLLAEELAATREEALEYYRKGVEAGRKALGDDFFTEYQGHFWGILESRPYMRARQGYATMLWDVGRLEEAVPHFQEMLGLNPNDNQGIRYLLLNVLLSLERDADAMALISRFPQDSMAEFQYTWALLLFRQEGASKKANRVLRKAHQHNAFVPAYLIGKKRVPAVPPAAIGWGDDSEAVAYAADYLRHWRRTEGAVDWLKKKTDSTSKLK